MRTKTIITSLSCALLILFPSCEKDHVSFEQSYLTFEASLDGSEQTKTYLDDVKVKWEASDSIGLWFGALGSKMEMSGYFVKSIDWKNDARQAVFNGFAEESPDYLAVYPLSSSTGCTAEGMLSVTMPVRQTATKNSFASNANIAVAYSNTTTLAFKNVGGLLAMRLNSDGGHEIESVRLTGTSAMSGEVNITQESIASGNPSVDALVDGFNYLILDMSDGISGVTKSYGSTKSSSVDGSGETFENEDGDWGKDRNYLVSLPGTHTGFVLTFVDSEGKAAVLKSTHAFTIIRNSNTLIANVSLSDADFKTDPQVYINEIDCQNKKIELYNPGSEAVDLSGWVLTKDESSWAFPVGSTIASKGYYVVTCKQKTDCSAGPMFGISGDKGFDLKLSNGGLVDRIDNLTSITTIAKGETYGRRTDGAADWVLFSTGTIYESGVCDGDNSKGTVKGDTPVVQSDVVLNEIDGNVKFIELYNKGTETVSLNGWTLEKNDETVWTGTSSNSIAAGSYLVVYSSKCKNIPEEAPVFSGGISSKQTLKVALKMASGNVTDTFTRGASPWGSDASECSNSFGRTPDGTGDWKLTDSTPGAANGASKGDIPQN